MKIFVRFIRILIWGTVILNFTSVNSDAVDTFAPSVRISDSMWDIDFEDEEFESSSEYRYLCNTEGERLELVRGGAKSTLTAHTGDSFNDMVIEDTGDKYYGKAIKMTAVTGSQNQFNEFRARNCGDIMVCEWDCKFEEIPVRQTGMVVKIMEPNIAPDMSGASEILTPYVALLYKNGEPYMGWTDGTDNDIDDVYRCKVQENVWYNIKTYTDFNSGVITYYIDDEYTASYNFDAEVYSCTEKYRALLYNAKGARLWIDNLKVYKALYLSDIGLGEIDCKIIKDSVDDQSGKLSVNTTILSDGQKRESMCYVAVYNAANALSDVYVRKVFFDSGETEYTLHIDGSNVTPDMKVRAFLWHGDSLSPASPPLGSSDFESEIMPKIFWKVDFENGNVADATLGAKGNVLEYGFDEEDNGCVKFERTASNDFHLDIFVSSYPSDTIVYQHDIKLLSKDVKYTSYLISSKENAFMYSVESGVLTAGNKKIRISADNRHTISVVYSVSERTFDVYLNYKLAASGIEVPVDYRHEDAWKWRIHVNRSDGDDRFYIDNMGVYSSDLPCSVGKGFVISNLPSLCESDSANIEFLRGKVAYHLRSGVLWANGVKTIVQSVTEDGVVYVPPAFFEEAWGMSVLYDTSSQKVNVGGFELRADSEKVWGIDGEYVLDDLPRMEDGGFLIPLEAFVTECLGKNVCRSDEGVSGGFVIISDSDIDLSAVPDIQKLNDFILYLRPSKEKIEADFELSGKRGVHPRLLADAEDFERIRTLVKTDANMKWWTDRLIAQADEICKSTDPLTYELRDGVRLLYVSYDMIDHMFALGFAYQLTGDKKYADRALIDLESVADFVDWHPGHALDVGVMACGYAVGYDWMYDAFTPEQRKHIENGAFNCGITTYADGYHGRNTYMANGITLGNNWTMVMNAGATMLGCAFYDRYPEYSAYLISNAVSCLESAIYKYAPDGAWYEGMGYAGMTLEYLTYQLATIENIFGTVYTLDAVDGLREIPEYYLYMQSPLGCFAYDDGSSQNVHFDAGMLWIGDHFKDYSALGAYNELFGFGTDVRTVLWYRPQMASAEEELSLDRLYDGQQVLTVRDTWDKNDHSVFAGIKGYTIDVGHGHMDHGSFLFYANGIRWTHEFGGEDYNLPGYWQGATYDAARWQYYRLRGEGHNTLIINPDEFAEFDPGKSAEFVRFECNQNGTIAVIDTTDANMGKVIQSQRGIYFTDGRQSLVVRDEIQAVGENTMYWFLHTAQNARLTSDGKGVILSDKNNKNNYVKLDFACNTKYELSIEPSVPLDTSPHPEGMADDSDISKVVLKIVADGNVSITAKLTPCTADVSKTVSDFDVPMVQWQIN